MSEKTSLNGRLEWNVRCKDGDHKLTLLHNTLTGNRKFKWDGEVKYKTGWSFGLVHPSDFKIQHMGEELWVRLTIRSKQLPNPAYIYDITVNNKKLPELSEEHRKISRTWKVTTQHGEHIVVLEKDKMDVWVDGAVVEAEDNFVDDGSETTFTIDGQDCVIHTPQITEKTGNFEKLHQSLYIGDYEVPETFENRTIIAG